ncbi:hypothetical protein [Thiomonas sp.]
MSEIVRPGLWDQFAALGCVSKEIPETAHPQIREAALADRLRWWRAPSGLSFETYQQPEDAAVLLTIRFVDMPVEVAAVVAQILTATLAQSKWMVQLLPDQKAACMGRWMVWEPVAGWEKVISAWLSEIQGAQTQVAAHMASFQRSQRSEVGPDSNPQDSLRRILTGEDPPKPVLH